MIEVRELSIFIKIWICTAGDIRWLGLDLRIWGSEKMRPLEDVCVSDGEGGERENVFYFQIKHQNIDAAVALHKVFFHVTPIKSSLIVINKTVVPPLCSL